MSICCCSAQGTADPNPAQHSSRMRGSSQVGCGQWKDCTLLNTRIGRSSCTAIAHAITHLLGLLKSRTICVPSTAAHIARLLKANISTLTWRALSTYPTDLAPSARSLVGHPTNLDTTISVPPHCVPLKWIPQTWTQPSQYPHIACL